MISFTTAKRIVASSIGDIAMRPFITVGFFAFLTMIPLAITSTTGWIRRMGGKKWAALHRLVYVTGIAGVVHYWWLVKADISRPETYAAIVALLLGVRVYYRLKKSRTTPPVRSVRVQADRSAIADRST